MTSPTDRPPYDPRFFVEDHVLEAPGLLGWLGNKRKQAIVAFVSGNGRELSKPRSLLDVGCGYGEMLSALAAPLKVGVDINAPALREARSRCPDSRFVLCDVEKLPFKAQVFDCVVCTEVLEHVDSPERLSAELVRVTRTAGRLCLTVPNELITTLGRFLLRKSPYKSPAHKTVFSWARLRRLFPLILLRRTHVPFGFLPFLISTNLVALFGKPGDGRA